MPPGFVVGLPTTLFFRFNGRTRPNFGCYSVRWATLEGISGHLIVSSHRPLTLWESKTAVFVSVIVILIVIMMNYSLHNYSKGENGRQLLHPNILMGLHTQPPAARHNRFQA